MCGQTVAAFLVQAIDESVQTVAKVADLANTRIYELQNAIEFRNPQEYADDA